MLLPKEISENLLVTESGTKFADDRSVEVFSKCVEAYLATAVSALVRNSSSSSSPTYQDISEESLMRELESGDDQGSRNIHISISDVREVLQKQSN